MSEREREREQSQDRAIHVTQSVSLLTFRSLFRLSLVPRSRPAEKRRPGKENERACERVREREIVCVRERERERERKLGKDSGAWVASAESSMTKRLKSLGRL